MGFWEWKCNSCKYYDIDKSKCMNKKCHTLGENTFAEYEKAYDCDYRELKYDQKQKNIEEMNKSYNNLLFISRLCTFSLIAVIIAGVYNTISYLTYTLNNPELTRTQLWIWNLHEHTLTNSIIVIGILICVVTYIRLTKK